MFYKYNWQQAYHGSVVDLSPEEMSAVSSIFASEEVIRCFSFYPFYSDNNLKARPLFQQKVIILNYKMVQLFISVGV
jgi:hypothetical protein